MAKDSKRTIVIVCPEWEHELERLKQEQFYNKTQEEMFQHLISLGLAVSKTKHTT